jgi:pimeloyl-ACP methyl ester carboxylesterase
VADAPPHVIEEGVMKLRIVAAFALLLLLGGIGWLVLRARSPYPSVPDLADAAPGQLVLRHGEVGGHPADFGTLAVLEDGSDPGSRRLPLPLVRIRSRSATPAEPIFLLHGGPGASNIQLQWLSEWMLDRHDMVMVGYRGVDGPVSLQCPEVVETLRRLDDPLTDASVRAIGEALSAAHRRLRDEGIDVRRYSVDAVVGDVEAARAALGYERIDLSSASFGTAVAYGYAADHPGRVRRNVMQAPTLAWDLSTSEPAASDAVLARLSEAWKKSPGGPARSADLVRTIETVLGTLPRKYADLTVTAGGTRLATYLLMYDRQTLLPLLDSFVAAEGGDLNGLGAMAAQWRLMVPGMNWGDIYAKTWSTLADPERLPAGADGGEGTIVGAPLARLAWGPAPHTSWPRTAAPRRWLEARAIPVETLFVTGENDVGTGTVESQLVPRFVNARVVRLPGMSHAEVTSRQLEAAARLQGRFYLEGVVDASAYVEEPLEFSPAPAFRDLGRQYARFPWAFKAFFFFKRLAG